MARAGRTNLRAAAARRDAGTPEAGVTALRSKPVRITADLDPELHAEVSVWVAQTGAALRRKLALVDVVRAVLRGVLEDKEFAEQVRDKITQYQQ